MTVSSPQSAVPGVKPGRSRMARQQQMWGVFFALPAILGFVIFTIGPMIASFVVQPDRLGDRRAADVRRGRQLPDAGRATSCFWQSLGVTSYYTLAAVPAGDDRRLRGGAVGQPRQAAAGRSGGPSTTCRRWSRRSRARCCGSGSSIPSFGLFNSCCRAPACPRLELDLQRGVRRTVTGDHEHLGLRQRDGDLPGRTAGRAPAACTRRCRSTAAGSGPAFGTSHGRS